MKQGAVVWITGVPASGKTTLARQAYDHWRHQNLPVLWLDSDALRSVMTPDASYTEADRDTFYDTLGYLAREAARGGTLALVSATASKRAYRERVRDQVEHFFEVWLQCDPGTLRTRDIKGLYAQADHGDVATLPGVGTTYEAPNNAELIVTTNSLSPEEVFARFLAAWPAAWTTA